MGGRSAFLVRSDNSYHSVGPVQGGHERLSLQVIWHKTGSRHSQWSE